MKRLIAFAAAAMLFVACDSSTTNITSPNTGGADFSSYPDSVNLTQAQICALSRGVGSDSVNVYYSILTTPSEWAMEAYSYGGVVTVEAPGFITGNGFAFYKSYAGCPSNKTIVIGNTVNLVDSSVTIYWKP